MMVAMVQWLRDLSTTELVLLVLGGALALAIVAALLGRLLVRVGLHTPFVVRRVNRLSERALAVVKRPITVAVLDEVVEVIQTGHYTRNIAAALEENREELVAMVREKLSEDQSLRLVSKVPLYGPVVHQASETTLRVVIEMLADPRMDELVSDLLRNNLQQIKQAVRAREHENVPRPTPPSRPGVPRITTSRRSP